MKVDDETYCFKCGASADFEIEVKSEDGKSLTTQNICEDCLMNLITSLANSEEEESK